MARLSAYTSLLLSLSILVIVSMSIILRQSPSTASWLTYVALTDNYTEIVSIAPNTTIQRRIILPTTNPTAAHYSPDGGWLVFHMYSESSSMDIYRIRLTGDDLQQLTADSRSEYFPSYSPDGQSITFFSDRTGSFDLYQMRPDGSNVHSLTEGPPSEQYPFWSPDGEWINFIVGAFGDLSLLRMRPDGSQRETVCSSSILISGYLATYSPNGNWLVIETRPRVSGTNNLFRVRPDCSELRQLNDISLSSSQPSWSPDGEWIAFQVEQRTFRGGDIYRMRPDGLDVQQLTHSPTHDLNPTWSPIVDQQWSRWRIGLLGIGLIIGAGSLNFWAEIREPTPLMRKVNNPPQSDEFQR